MDKINKANKKQLINYYIIKWIRINCNENVLDGDFLICFEGYGPSMNTLKTDAKNLFEKLKSNYRISKNLILFQFLTKDVSTWQEILLEKCSLSLPSAPVTAGP